MDSRKAKKIAKEINYNLEIVLSNRELSTKISTPEFRKNIVSQLSMLKQLFIESKTNENELFKLIDKFNLFLPENKISASEVNATNYKEESEFIDEANYLKVYIKNAFGRDFGSYSNNVDELKKLDKLDNGDIAAVTIKTPQEEYDYSKTTNSSMFGTNSSSAYNYGDPESWKKKVKSEMIMKRIGEDYTKGNYYFYTSKPPIIPIMKKIAAVFTLFVGLVFIATVIIGIIGNASEIKIKDNKDKEVNLTIINPFNGTIFSALGVWVTITSIKQFKPIKNDNIKYSVNNISYYISFIMGAVILLQNITNDYGIDELMKELYSINPKEKADIAIAFFSMNYVVAVIFILQIIFPIVNNIFRPQRNTDLDKALWEKYSKEIDEAGILK